MAKIALKSAGSKVEKNIIDVMEYTFKYFKINTPKTNEIYSLTNSKKGRFAGMNRSNIYQTPITEATDNRWEPIGNFKVVSKIKDMLRTRIIENSFILLLKRT